MKNIALAMMALFLITACSDKTLTPKIDGYRYGYVDKEDNFIVSPEFHEAKEFRNGYAVVVKNGLYGFINRDGKIAIEPQYTHASSFSKNGYAIIRDDWDRSYIINTKNEKITTDKYEYLWFFYDYFTFREGNARGLLDENLKPIFKSTRYYIKDIIDDEHFLLKDLENDSKYNLGIMKKSGKIILEPIYSFSGMGKNGLIVIEKDGLYGLVNIEGKFILDIKYEKINNAYGYPINFVKLGGKWGAVDGTGKFIIEPKYSSVDTFNSHGIAAVYENGSYALIDKTGKIINDNRYSTIYISDEYIRAKNGDDYIFIDAKNANELKSITATTIGYFQDGYASIKNGDVVVGMLDMDLNITKFPDGYHSIGNFNSNSYTTIKKSNRYGLIDRSGKIIIEPKYDWLSYSGYKSDNHFIIAEQDRKRFLIDLKEQKILDGNFTNIMSKGNNLYEVSINNKEGIIQLDGRYLIEPKFNRIRSERGVYIATLGDKQGLLNSDGEYILEPIYDSISSDLYININGKHNRINREGKYLYNQFYDEIIEIDDIDIVKLDGKYGMHHLDKMVLDTNYSSIKKAFDERELLIIELDNKFGLYKNSDEILALEYDEITPLTLESIKKESDESDDGHGDINLVTTATIIIMGENKNQTNTYSSELLLIKKDGKYGLISADLELHIEPKFDELEVISRDIYKVKVGDKYGIINSDLEYLQPLEYDSLRAFDGRFIASKDSKFGIITANSMLLDFIYDSIEPTIQGVVVLGRDSHFGIADIINNQLTDIEYDSIVFTPENSDDYGNAWWKNYPNLTLVKNQEKQNLIYGDNPKDIAFQIEKLIIDEPLDEHSDSFYIDNSSIKAKVSIKTEKFIGKTNYQLCIDREDNSKKMTNIVDTKYSLMCNRHQSLIFDISASSFNELNRSFDFAIKDADAQSLILMLGDDYDNYEYHLYFSYDKKRDNFTLDKIYSMNYERYRYGKGDLEYVYLVDAGKYKNRTLDNLDMNEIFDYLFFSNHQSEKLDNVFRK